MSPRSQTCRTRPQHEPLQHHICRRQRPTEAHDHHARPHHSYEATRPTTPRHENQTHLQCDIKARKRQHGGSSRNEHRDPTARSGNQIHWSTHHLQKRHTSRVLTPHQMRVGYIHEPQAGVDVTKYPLRDRPKLFDATVTPSLLHASGTRNDGRCEAEALDSATTLRRHLTGQSRRRAGALGRQHNESNAQGGRPVSSKLNHVLVSQAEPGKDDCQTLRRLLDQACLLLEPSNINQAKGYLKQGRPATRWEDDLNIHLQPDRSNRDHKDLTRYMTCLTTAEDSLKRVAMDSDFISSRLKQQHDPRPLSLRQRNQQRTTTQQVRLKTHDQNEDDTKDDDELDDDTLRILSQFNRQLNLYYTIATTSGPLVQKAATRVSHDTLTLSVTHLLPSTDARPLYFKREEI